MVIKTKFGRYLNEAPFFYNLIVMSEDKNEELRPTKMRGVAFPKAKYGVILAIILIVVVSFILYKETIFSFFK